MGTHGYMAPEQYAGDADVRSDLYGLGALAIGLLTREPPHAMQDADRTLAFAHKVALSDPLRELLTELTAVDPDARPESAAQVQERVRQCSTRRDLPAHPEARGIAVRDRTTGAVVVGAAKGVGLMLAALAPIFGLLYVFFEPAAFGMLFTLPILLTLAITMGVMSQKATMDLRDEDPSRLRERLIDAIERRGFTIARATENEQRFHHWRSGTLTLTTHEGHLRLKGPRSDVLGLHAQLSHSRAP